MGKIGQVLTVFVILAVPLSCIPLGFEAKANPFTEVTIQLQDEPPKVDVSPGSPGIVSINGVCECFKVGPDQVKVYLEATSETGGASVIPPSFVFTTSDNVSFGVTTRVPTGYSCSETPIVTVDGYYDQGGFQYDIAPQSIMIIIMQYYLIDANPEDLNISAKAGGNAEFDIDISNAGNGNDVFTIDFIDREQWEEKGFGLPYSMDVTIAEDANRSFHFNIDIPQDKSGVYPLQLSIISQGSQETDSPEQLIVPIMLRVLEQSIGEKIGSLVLSPLSLIIIVVVLIAAFVLIKIRRG